MRLMNDNRLELRQAAHLPRLNESLMLQTVTEPSQHDPVVIVTAKDLTDEDPRLRHEPMAHPS